MTSSIETLIQSMIDKYAGEVEVSDGVMHSDKQLKRVSNLYLHSKFENVSTDEMRQQGIVFMNIINQAVRAFEANTGWTRKDILLEIRDTIVEYLANVANEEMMDDEDAGQLFKKFVTSVAKYGTAVFRIRKKAEKGRRIEILDFNKIIWDQNDYRQAPIIYQNSVKLNVILNNRIYATKELVDMLKQDKVDLTNPLSRIDVFEVYGDLPRAFRTQDIEDIEIEKQYHVVAYYKEKFYPLLSIKTDKETIAVYRRNPIDNRSMGQSVVEELLEAQVQTNEVANLLIKELRNLAKTVYQTTDEGLDGLDLNEIDDFTVIKTERDTRLDIFPQRQSNFMAFQNYMAMWANQSKESSGANNAILGIGEGTREPVGTRGLKVQASEKNYSVETAAMAAWFERVYKDYGLLEVVYSYFDNIEHLEQLMTDEQLLSFHKFVAKQYAKIMSVESALADGEDMAPEEFEDIIFKALQDGNAEIDYTDYVIDKKEFIDKVRVKIVDGMRDREAQISALQLLSQYLLQNPVLAEKMGINLEDVITKLVSLTDGNVIPELNSAMAQMKNVATSPNDPVNNK